MGPLQEIKDQFEENLYEIVSSEFDDSFDITDEDLENCFKSVMIDDEFGRVYEAITDSIIEWIETNKEDQIDRNEKIKELEGEIAYLEAKIEDYKDELSSLIEDQNSEEVTGPSPSESWDSLSNVDRW